MTSKKSLKKTEGVHFHGSLLQRDEDGDFQTTLVAIDATQFKNSPREAQYEECALIRELNKALVGFYNPELGSQVIQTHSGRSFCALFSSNYDAVSVGYCAFQ